MFTVGLYFHSNQPCFSFLQWHCLQSLVVLVIAYHLYLFIYSFESSLYVITILPISASYMWLLSASMQRFSHNEGGGGGRGAFHIKATLLGFFYIGLYEECNLLLINILFKTFQKVLKFSSSIRLAYPWRHAHRWTTSWHSSLPEVLLCMLTGCD